MSIDLPGFVDPVTDAQQCFRALLDAFSRPGSLNWIGDTLTPPEPLSPAAAAVLLTLVDVDTPIWLDPKFASTKPWIAFHCGAPSCAVPRDAAFNLAQRLPEFSQLNAGSDEAPGDAATLILQVPGFGRGQKLRLAGPGLRTTGLLEVDGLPVDFVDQWQENHKLYPRGIDLILCSGTAIAALPRSILIEVA